MISMFVCSIGSQGVCGEGDSWFVCRGVRGMVPLIVRDGMDLPKESKKPILNMYERLVEKLSVVCSVEDEDMIRSRKKRVRKGS